MQTLCVRSVEFRAVDQQSGDGRTLEGYAVVFNTPAEISSWDGDFLEQVAPGAFRKTLKKKTPVLQYDHGRDARTGSVPIGSIEDVHEDETGVYVLARLYDNPVVEPIRQAIEGGSIHGMSFRFHVIRDQWHDRDGVLIKSDELSKLLWEPGERGPLQRTILEVDCHELGPVVFPAYDSTTVGVRSLLAQLDPDEHKALIRELAGELRTYAERAVPKPLTAGDVSEAELADWLARAKDNLAANPTELTGRPSARSAGGGDTDPTPDGEPGSTSSSYDDPSLRHGVLRALGAI
jgi:uncharacterized protein